MTQIADTPPLLVNGFVLRKVPARPFSQDAFATPEALPESGTADDRSGDANPWQPSWGGGIGYWSHPNETSEHIPPDLVPGVIASDAWVFVLEANLHYQPGGRWFFGAGLQGWAEISDNADTSDVLQSLRAHAFLGLKW